MRQNGYVMLTALVLVTSWLSGCATAGSCSLLLLREYNAPFTAKLLGELEAAPTGAAWPVFAADSVALRDAVRACRGD